MNKRLILIGVAAAVVAGSWAILSRQNGHAQAVPLGPPQVTVAKVMERPVGDSANFIGKVQAVDSVKVQPRVSGYVQAVKFQEGALVHKGEVLFKIDPRPFQAEVDRLAAQREQARSQLDLARANAVINLGAGETVECTFNDTQLSTITVSVISTGGTDTFGFGSTNLGANSFSLTTPADGEKASRTFGNLPPGTYSVTGLGAPGWTFDQLLCVAESGERYWTIANQQATITLPHGEAIECTYYYLRPLPPPPTVAAPMLSPSLYIFIFGIFIVMVWREARTHR